VIVIDDGSTDETAQIAERHPVELIRTEHRGPAHARNAGAQAANGEILAFIDADITCSAVYLEQLVKPIVEGDVAGSFSKEIYIGNMSNRWACAYARIRRLAVPRLLPESSPDHSANYRAVLRQRFAEVGGFAEVGYGEDMTLAPKLGELAVAAPGAVCWHYNPDSIAEIFENARWIGRGHDIAELQHPWASNSPLLALRKAFAEIRAGEGQAIVPARLAYSVGILIGLAHRALWPERHWK
jgi:glycosyltransferase involved in cell wall biosynthesis